MSKTFGNFTDLMDFSRSSGGTALRKVSYGSELVTNGTFDSDYSGWTTVNTNATNTITWNNGAIDFVCDGSVSLGLSQNNVFTVGKLYQLKIDVTVNAGDAAGIKIQYTGTDSSIGVVLVSGSYTFNFVAGGVNLDIFRRQGGAATNVTFDNVSVKEVTLDSGTDDPVVFNHPADIPRIEYAADGTVKGLLIEEDRTNLFTQDNPSASAWYKNQSSVTANAATAPDGTNTASKIVENTATAVHYVSETITVTGDTTYTMSVFAKAGERGYLKLQCGFVSNWVLAHDIIFDLSDGSLHHASSVNSVEGTHFGSYDMGNGWYRLWISGTTISSATAAGFNLHLATGVGNEVNYTGDGTSGVYVWGAQFEQGSFATSYIPTSGATVSRSADLASIAVDNLGINDNLGTIVCDFDITFNAGGSGYPRIFEYGSTSTAGNRINAYIAEISSTLACGVNTNSVGQASLSLSVGASSPLSGKVALAFDENDIACCVDGGTVQTDTSANLSDPSTRRNMIRFGSQTDNANSFINGHIRDFQYYPRRLTNRQLQELTGATNTYDYTTVDAGTITRSAVATGADLVAYSGFNTSNYLQQPYNADLDFGTGDFCVMAWNECKSSSTEAIFIRQSTSGSTFGTGAYIYLATSLGKILARTSGGVIYNQGPVMTGAGWHLLTMVRRSGVLYAYVNGELIGSASDTSNLDNSGAVSRVGILTYNESIADLHDGEIALLRVTATAPTATQIAKIYEDEKFLFMDGAQSTLYGSSDAVTALAYDDDTNLLHVGTSAGRSVFQGLRRVENTTDAIGTAISAANGLVVEE